MHQQRLTLHYCSNKFLTVCSSRRPCREITIVQDYVTLPAHKLNKLRRAHKEGHTGDGQHPYFATLVPPKRTRLHIGTCRCDDVCGPEAGRPGAQKLSARRTVVVSTSIMEDITINGDIRVHIGVPSIHLLGRRGGGSTG